MEGSNVQEAFLSERVKYLCSCGFLKPVYRVYFCRHCVKIRCGNCVSQEVSQMLARLMGVSTATLDFF